MLALIRLFSVSACPDDDVSQPKSAESPPLPTKFTVTVKRSISTECGVSPLTYYTVASVP